MNVRNMTPQLFVEIVIAICLVIIVFMEYLRPAMAELMYGSEYKKLALECDYAMHEEVSAKAFVGDEDVRHKMVISGDVGLAVCHEYDVLRKRLLGWGMDDFQLAKLGLEVLEIERIPVGRMVEPHKMSRY